MFCLIVDPDLTQHQLNFKYLNNLILKIKGGLRGAEDIMLIIKAEEEGEMMSHICGLQRNTSRAEAVLNYEHPGPWMTGLR